MRRITQQPARTAAFAALGAVCLTLLSVPATLHGQEQATDAVPGAEQAVVIPIDGEIDSLTLRTFEMRMDQAVAMNPRMIIVSIETPGAELEASRKIAWRLRNLDTIDTVAFVRGRVLSGGTMVAMGCDIIASRPDGQLGDVMPIAVDILRLNGVEVAEKMISPVRQDLRDLARDPNYPPELGNVPEAYRFSPDAAESMVDPSLELHRLELRNEATGRIETRWVHQESLDSLPWEDRSRVVKDEVVCHEGELLVLGAEDAWDMGLVQAIADDEDALCKALAEELSIPQLTPVEVSGLWWEGVVRFLTWWPVKILLFVIGMMALAIAVSSPGMGVPEVTALICLGAVFFGSYLIGLADYIEIALFVVGVIFIVTEVLTPSFGVLGIGGLLMVAVSLVMSFQEGVPRTPDEWTIMAGNAGKAGVAMTGSLVGLVALARVLPKAGPLSRLVHSHEHAAGASDGSEGAASLPALAAIGTSGVTATVLRPSGKVEIAGSVHDAVCEDGFAAKGIAIVVVGHQVNALIVASRPEATTVPGGQPQVEAPADEAVETVDAPLDAAAELDAAPAEESA
ncbi:hypothetical protein OAX78_01730 [Planctomycetota bacterium]|nr:hypothetical protein [Planctomycetota bacterium]